MKKNTETIKQGLLLLGSFGIAYNLTVLFHEMSHGLAAVLTGGTFSDMIINPFSWSYSSFSSPNPLICTGAGALGGIIIAGVIYSIFCWKACSGLLPLLLVAPISFLFNGTYYIADIAMRLGGDASRLLNAGVYPVVLITLSVVCIMVGLAAAVSVVRKTDLLFSNHKGRLVVLILGVFPTTLAMLTWNCIFNRTEVILWGILTIAVIIMALIVAVVPKRIWKRDVHQPQELKWKTITMINLLYVGLLIFWFVGPFSEN